MLSNKKTLFKLYVLVLIVAILSLSTLVYSLLNQSSKSKDAFNNFMDSYVSKDIENANNYILNTKLPDIPLSFSEVLTLQDDEIKNQIITLLEELMFSIKYEILHAKPVFNKSTLTIKFTYYDIAKHIINFFKNNLYYSENSYMEFLNSLKSTKYIISTNVDVELSKINNEWYLTISDKLLNILTGGLYKNFII